MNRDKLRQMFVILGIVGLVGMNILANALPFNNLTTGEISGFFDVYFVPAGYVFSIWGLIYLGLIGYGIFQALPGQRENPKLRRMGYWFFASCFANVAWLLCWHFLLFEFTLVWMLALLSCLIVIYDRLEIGQTLVANVERLLVHLPFQIYLGWISVATIANISDVFWYRGWNGAPLLPEWWAMIMLAIGGLLALTMVVIRRDAAYVFVLLWAYVGIAIKQAATPLVANAAWAGVVALAVLAGVALLRRTTPQTKISTAD